MGLSCVIHDHNGAFVTAQVKRIQCNLGAKMAEALAISEALIKFKNL